MKFEYKVIPAPKKASKVKGLKRGADRFAASLMELMNKLGAEGWEYQRTDTLPVESRAGLTSRITTFQNMLVFRRVISEMDEVVEPVTTSGPDIVSRPEIVAQAAPAANAENTQPASVPREVAAQ